MALKKLNTDTVIPAAEIDKTLAGVSPDIFDSSLDKAEEVEIDEDKPFFEEPTEKDENPTMTLNKEELYENRGFTPATLLDSGKGEGFVDTHKISEKKKSRIVIDNAKQKQAKPASEVDLENLDESMILNMPEIKAASFEIIDLLNPKPKDKAVRFRWANFKNHVAGNLARYYSLGFAPATLDDVDLEKTPIDPSMVDGTSIRYYDVVLIKINVLRLMALYKANILKSVNRLVKSKERGIAEANRQFQSALETEAGAVRGYNKTKEALGGRDPVEFYTPNVEEIAR